MFEDEGRKSPPFRKEKPMKKQSRSQRSRLQDFREFNQWLRKRVRSQLAGEEYVFTREDFGKISGSVGMTNHLISRFGGSRWYQKTLESWFFGRPEQNLVQTRLIPLNAQVKDRPSAVMPYRMIDDVIEKASFRLIMHECICRKGTGCTDYPIDFGCLFLGEGARTLLKGDVGRGATIEEAKAHIRKAGEMKLVPLAAYVKLEQWVMGISKENHSRLLEICLCCPCCCLGLRNLKHISPEGRRQVFLNIGFVAKAFPTCQGCFDCVSACPAGAIKTKGDKVWVKEDECVGCGLCQNACPHQAIRLVQIKPARGGILDYFDGLHLDVS